MTNETRDQSNRLSGASNQPIPSRDDSPLQALGLLRVLIPDALEAGKYLHPDARWEPYYGGWRLVFRDRRLGEELPGLLVIADHVTEEMLYDPDGAGYGSVVIIGAYVAADVDLGKARAHRLELGSSYQEVYWAVFVLQDSILITIGGPSSSCRLISEILNAQMGEPFIQRRICAHCYAVNVYHERNCIRCGKSIISTGRLNQWME